MKPLMISIALLMVSVGIRADDMPKTDWGGYLMLDHSRFSELYLEDGEGDTSSSDVRRARFGVEVDWSKDWLSKAQVDLSEGDSVEIKDLWLKYQGWKWFDITLGQQKEPFGLEKLTGSRKLFLLERSMVTSALAPGRNVGAQLDGKLNRFTWQLGYFQEGNSERTSAITGRAAWAHQNRVNDFIHLGAAFSVRDLNGSEFRVNETLEVYGADSLLEGNRLEAESASLKGVELMWQYQGLASMAEWQRAEIENMSGTTYRYQGGYYQVSYLLSGKNRRYKKGKLKSFDASSDWEFALRYSQFELEEEQTKATNWSAGVNYWVNKDLVVKFNYIRSERQDEEVPYDADNAIALRVQYSF